MTAAPDTSSAAVSGRAACDLSRAHRSSVAAAPDPGSTGASSSAPVPARRPFDLAALAHVLERPVSDEQAGVVTAPLEAGVVVAGAGSGKTATMVARVVWLVAQGRVAPDGVLGLTFTTKAADELAGRVRAGLRRLRHDGYLPDELADLEPTISTYHSYAARLVREHALRIGREPTARLITPATSWQLAARAVAAHDGPMDAVSWAESTVVHAVLTLAGDLAEHLVLPEQVFAMGRHLDAVAATAVKLQSDARKALACQRTREQLLPVVARYTEAKRVRELLDFADVVALAAHLARDCPDVRDSERAAFPVVLLDEYQDTGAAQEVLLSALFGDGHAVTAVGDPCQSIYGWRGASAGTLRRFPTRFGAGGAPRSLHTTYRSGGRVLLLANAVSGELRHEGVPVPELSAAAGREYAGQVRCALLADVDEEAHWVARQVRDAVQALPPDERGRHWGRAAVLCRKRAMFPRLREAFEELDVPVEVVGLGGLLAVPEVADLVATLRVLDDPTADADLLRLLTGPRWRIGPHDLAVLGRQARALVRGNGARPDDPLQAVVLGVDETRVGSLVDALDELPPHGLSRAGRQRLEQLRDELAALRRRADQPLPELVADVERTLGLDVEVAARQGAANPAAARADLDAFSDAAAQFAGDVAQDGTGEAVLSAFLAYLAAAQDEENGLDTGAVSGADTVQLMTVHAAKGLEWPVVAVPGLARSSTGGAAVFPGKPQGTSWLANPRLLPFPLRGDADDLPALRGLEPADVRAFCAALTERDAREERRLAYVAFTRAEQLLLCSGYHWGEGSKPLGPSEFLDEARTACEAGAGRVDRWDAAPGHNPVLASSRTAPWPTAPPPAGAGVQRAADRVRELLDGEPPGHVPGLSPQAARRVAEWEDDLRRLQDEAQRRAARRATAVLPGSLPVSALVELRRDPVGLARALLRPLPRRPSPVTRRGTAFHAWLESSVFGIPQLLDPFELPGSADEAVGPDVELAALQDAFRRSAWWGRLPVEIEVPFEMELEGVVVRGRMDAVYRTEGGYDVVDWKTGSRPRGVDAEAAAVQLAAYRLAWHRLSGTPLEQVGAAFHYVRGDVTLRPADLLDEAGLRRLLRALPVAGGPTPPATGAGGPTPPAERASVGLAAPADRRAAPPVP